MSHASATSRPVRSEVSAISRIMQGESFESIRPLMVLQHETINRWHYAVNGAVVAITFAPSVSPSVITEMERLCEFLLNGATR